MTTKSDVHRSASVFSTMLISKRHRRANHELRRRMLLVMKQPRLSWMKLEGFDVFSKLVALIGGLIITFLVVFIAEGFSYGIYFLTEGDLRRFDIKIGDPFVGIILLIFGIYLANRIFHWYANHPPGTVGELNTFMIAYKPVKSPGRFDDEDTRIAYEEKIRNAHRLYKRSLLSRVRNDVKNDFELKNSQQLLLKCAKAFGKGPSSEIKEHFKELVEEWVWGTLDRVHKGTRITYWNNVTGMDRLILADYLNQKKLIELDETAEEIVDELQLLVFANRYGSVMAPLLQQSFTYTKQFGERATAYVKSINKDSTHNEHFAEAVRVLLSKTLGMQEVLKSTSRQIERMRQAKDELAKEARRHNSPELELLTNEFMTEEAFASFLELTERLKEQLSSVSSNLRTLDFEHVPMGSSKDLKYISNFYLALEKLRFMTTWFEDIASYTTVAGGIGFETGVITTKDEKIPEDVVLKAEDIFKNYHTGGGTIYALRGASFEIKKGEFVGLIGPSGSGKTTLLNIMAGLDEPDRGAIYVNGVNLQSLSERGLTKLRSDEMGFIFQFYNLLPVLNNKENVAYPAEMAGKSKNLSQRASDNLTAVQLQDFEQQYPNKLSGGQMQRVTIARSLINTPSILFADEPTGDLDSVTGKEIMDFLARFNKDHGTTVILVTHDKG
ncbi:MAG: ABC transporter ATP-binding protein, partial [Candidatus Hodarchaeales archaeon]